MGEILVYQNEINDGVAEIVKANACISYVSPIMKLNHESAIAKELIQNFAKAHIDSDYNKCDLYPLYGVLVSAGITNKNDDTFTIEEVWAARNSPEDKPFNLMHKDIDIIGHITSNYPVDSNFNRIPDDTPVDKLPSKFHVITSSVVYKVWQNVERRKQIAKILQEIDKGGKWALSMECLFRDFAYQLTSANGEKKIVERNEHTSGLTKHLRIYRGSGSYENYKIDRVLRGITFSGKGLVDNPANEESIIFDKEYNFNSVSNKTVYSYLSTETNQESIMSDTALANIEKLLTDLKTEVSSANLDRIHVLESQIEALKKGVDEHQTHISKHEAEKKALVDQHAGQMNAVTAELTETKAKVDKAEKDKEEAEKVMCTVKAENEAMKKTLDEFKKASKKTQREKALLKTNLKADAIEKTLETFANLDDETFNAMVTTFAMDYKDDDESDDTQADFGAHPVDGDAPTTKDTKTQDVNQFGKTKPKNDKAADCNASDVLASASVEPSSNLGVSDLEKSIAKVQTDIQKYLSKGKKVKGE